MWREVDLIDSKVFRHVVVTLDATMRTATILTVPQALELAEGLRTAAENHSAAT